MQVVRKDESKKFQNGEHCAAYEYPMEDKDINGAVIEISGRYPENGRAVNLECKELAYVVSGSGKAVVDRSEIELGEGDLLLIMPGEKYYWEGSMTMFMPCAPAWRPEQHKMTD